MLTQARNVRTCGQDTHASEQVTHVMASGDVRGSATTLSSKRHLIVHLASLRRFFADTTLFNSCAQQRMDLSC